MEEAQFYTSSDANSVQCRLCARRCVIPDGATGFCKVRANRAGTLYSLVYGNLCSLAIDPIEKKPLYMFAPGSQAISLSTVGCNFRCSFCCNWSISQAWDTIYGDYYAPQQLIQMAQRRRVQGFAYTYTEPTIFYEFAYDTAKLAHEHGFYNMFVTNGYTTPDAITQIAPYLDAVVVDLKGSLNPTFYHKFIQIPNVEPIYDALASYQSNNIYTEITDLIVPTYGDRMEDVEMICRWIVDHLGPEIPFHILQFFPTYKLQEVSRTPVPTLEAAYDIAKKAGLHYVYVGNVHGHTLENTYCLSCHHLLIHRTIRGVVNLDVTKDYRCPQCGATVPISGTRWIPARS